MWDLITQYEHGSMFHRYFLPKNESGFKTLQKSKKEHGRSVGIFESPAPRLQLMSVAELSGQKPCIKPTQLGNQEGFAREETKPHKDAEQTRSLGVGNSAGDQDASYAEK